LLLKMRCGGVYNAGATRRVWITGERVEYKGNGKAKRDTGEEITAKRQNPKERNKRSGACVGCFAFYHEIPPLGMGNHPTLFQSAVF
jgi:hypothetical protein